MRFMLIIYFLKENPKMPNNNIQLLDYKKAIIKQLEQLELLEKSNILKYYILIIAITFIPFKPIISMCIFSYLILLVKLQEAEEKNRIDVDLIRNLPSEKYLIKMGRGCKKHFGSAKYSGRKKNLTSQFVLFDTEKVKRMFAMIGTIGSGKTVALRGILEQALQYGGGALIIDGKGTTDELKRVIALVNLWNRQRDLYIINFADPKNTNSIDLLSIGTAEDIMEMFIDLIPSTDPKWAGVSENYLKNILRMLVYKRDILKENIKIEDVKKYSSMGAIAKEIGALIKGDTKPINEKTFEERYFSKSLEEVLSYICVTIAIDFESTLSGLKEDNVEKFVALTTEKYEEMYAKGIEDSKDAQGAYDFSVGSNEWNTLISDFVLKYGAVFNRRYADLKLTEAISNNKIIWVVLPSMKSDKTARNLGMLILGMIRRVADDKTLFKKEPIFPYLFLFDEVGSYAPLLLGRFMSKSRSLGMTIIPIFQSKSQLTQIDDGKGLEEQEMSDMFSATMILKTDDIAITVDLNEKFKKEKRLREETRENKQDDTNYTIDEEDYFERDVLSKQGNGECHIITSGKAIKAIAPAPTYMDMTYRDSQIASEIEFPLLPLMRIEEFRVNLKTLVNQNSILNNEREYHYLLSSTRIKQLLASDS